MQNWEQIRPIILYWMLAMGCIAAFFALSIVLCGVTECSKSTLSGLNLIGLLAILACSLAAVYAFLRINAQLLFTPVIAYAGACALFYGFGPMSTFLASPESLAFQAQSIYAVSAEQVLRTNLLTSFGIAASLLSLYFFLPRHNRALAKSVIISPSSIAVLFLVFGLILKHVIIMPAVYGTASWQVPGILANLRYLPDLGFALIAMLGAAGHRRWAIAFWLIWPFQFLLSFPEFSKQSVMLTMLLPAIGAYVGHRSLPRLLSWILVAAAIFTVLQNANTISRFEASQANEDGLVLGVEERLEILYAAIVDDETAASRLPMKKQGVDTWWQRLNFSGPQNAAMELHDSGVDVGFTQNLLIYFVPRFLWPDKPTMASPGQEFHQIVTQNPNSQTRVGITVFADGYLKLGWFGVALFSGIVGLIMAVITRLTMDQLSRGQYLYLPAAMLGIQTGASSSTAWLQNAFLAGLPVYFGYCLMVYLIYGQLGQLRHRSRERNRELAYGTA